MKIYMKSFKCYRDTSEVDSDEPYVLVFAADRENLKANTTLYGRWGNTDSGDTGRTGMVFAGPGGAPLIPPENFWNDEMPNPEHVIFLAALMENDNGNPGAVRAGLNGMLYADFVAALGVNRLEVPRETVVARLKKTMLEALTGPIAIGIPNKDDLIDVQVVDVRNAARRGGTTVVSTQMRGDGGHYELFFNVVN
ncbi:hypothetical protein GJW-30_1_00479 [Variibacter gotjawalensis]|uniref:Uncharacterized protein n=1 Tax=Variibacter gotjawalensis TaxID=1333996 RepID=A0A0S3PPX5_9BRAD|nr:hypothetical protein [Variibacter gotjawalensis]NIK48265.1 hypothetical protein [Variibacter gotjawalensis]RZS50137.1 hypothetical protein EV661_2589 [Variibacter gotjawalensis]BAT57967.1 hypothetical protein GJW-30_1_00479 [Variibacter gotjawalensis]